MAPADCVVRGGLQLGGQRAVGARQSKLPGQRVIRACGRTAGTGVLPRHYVNRNTCTSCFGKNPLTAPAT